MYQDVLLFIDGAWSAAAAGRSLPVVSPATGDVVGTVAHAERANLDRALESVELAWEVLRPRRRVDASLVEIEHFEGYLAGLRFTR